MGRRSGRWFEAVAREFQYDLSRMGEVERRALRRLLWSNELRGQIDLEAKAYADGFVSERTQELVRAGLGRSGYERLMASGIGGPVRHDALRDASCVAVNVRPASRSYQQLMADGLKKARSDG